MRYAAGMTGWLDGKTARRQDIDDMLKSCARATDISRIAVHSQNDDEEAE